MFAFPDKLHFHSSQSTLFCSHQITLGSRITNCSIRRRPPSRRAFPSPLNAPHQQPICARRRFGATRRKQFDASFVRSAAQSLHHIALHTAITNRRMYSCVTLLRQKIVPRNAYQRFSSHYSILYSLSLCVK